MALPIFLKLAPVIAKVGFAAYWLVRRAQRGWRYEYAENQSTERVHRGHRVRIARYCAPSNNLHNDRRVMLIHQLRSSWQFDLQRKEFLHVGRRARTGVGEFDTHFYIPAVAAHFADLVHTEEHLRGLLLYLIKMLRRHHSQFYRMGAMDHDLALAIVLGGSTDRQRLYDELIDWFVELEEALPAPDRRKRP